MKFSNGNWLTREGFNIASPRRLKQVLRQANELVCYASYHDSPARSATIGGPLFTIRITSPLENVVRVRVEHNQGVLVRGPEFSMSEAAVGSVSTGEDEAAVWLKTGSLIVRIPKAAPWSMEFWDGDRLLTRSAPRAMGYIRDAQGQAFMREQLRLGVGENVYGLGERFTAFVKNGQSVDIWNEDGGTNSEQSYKNVPFYLTNRGYGVLVNHPEAVSMEVASEKVSEVQFSVDGEALEYLVINGPTPKEVLTRYTTLTGKPALPPAWSFGLWLTTSFTTDYDEETATSFIEGMVERKIPLSVFHFDCFWMREYEWCNFEWDERAYPDPVGMLARLHDRGLKVSVWINPYIGQRAALFAEAQAAGYLLKRPDGSVWQWDLWQPGMGIVDFTNPEARAWFADKLHRLMAMGVDAFKTDFGERIPLDVVYADGSDPKKMHNYYAYLYNRTVFEALAERRPDDAVVFARSATVGSQQFPVHWGGDCQATYESMAESLRGGLSLGLSGFGFWSHDIGGFEGTPTADLYKRWIAFGLLSTHSRLHGNASYRVPWLFDEESVDVLRYFAELKNQLMPYLYQAAIDAHQFGWPVMRAMMMEFPEDIGTAGLDRQYMLGDALLVAPVMSADGNAQFYLPEGEWVHLLTDSTLTGGGWRQERFDYFSLPAYVRPNSLIAIGAGREQPDYDYAEGVGLHLFSLADGRAANLMVPNLAGETILTARAERSGGHIVIEVDNPQEKAWSLVLRGGVRASAVDSGEIAEGSPGQLIRPHLGTQRISIRLVE